MDTPQMTDAKPTGLRALVQPRVLDRLEQVVILVLWVFLVKRVLDSENPLAPLALIAETSVMFFTMIRRPTLNISVNLRDWFLAASATGLPLLITAGPNPWPSLAWLGVVLVAAGNIQQVLAKLFLRRSFGIAPANRGIKVEGPYRWMRHPMYAGYLVVHIGVMVLMPSLFNLAIYGAAWTTQVLRLLAEERLLGEDPVYREYMQKVRWRLIPGVF